MTVYLIKRGDEFVGYVTDNTIAEMLDGKEIVTDGRYATETYAAEEVPNDDVL